MPVYMYRREDGTTFEYKQKFLDEPLTVDPETGQKVVRVIQPTGVIFKGSGFYVNDSKSASKSNLNSSAKSDDTRSETTTSDSKPESTTTAEGKSDTTTEKKSDKKSDKKAS